MISTAYFKEQFEELQSGNAGSSLGAIRQRAFHSFNNLGIPNSKQEEWKYTRIGGLFNKDYAFADKSKDSGLTANDLNEIRLPGSAGANEIVFVNGQYAPELSAVRSSHLEVLPLEQAASNQYRDIVAAQLGHSANYNKDGINALNTAFVHGGVFVHIPTGKKPDHPVYIYHLANARERNIFAQPRSLFYLSEASSLEMIEDFATFGAQESFTNHITEIVQEKDSTLYYYKIQNDKNTASQVSTTHIRHIGKSFSQSVVISLTAGIIRNNLNVILESKHCESHLYGLYYPKGHTHIDNHTLVDNVEPNCYSNELYKGVMDDDSTAVFNGKIYVRRDAQKTNAYQSNKNILASDSASVNTKPQLEIFADDVKCSHGCTIGSLDEEAVFYLRSRGVSLETARALLLQAFAVDVLEHIGLEPLRAYINQLILKRLEIEGL